MIADLSNITAGILNILVVHGVIGTSLSALISRQIHPVFFVCFVLLFSLSASHLVLFFASVPRS
jgi:uncharacterized membrane protein YjjP (DUF1212 family)